MDQIDKSTSCSTARCFDHGPRPDRKRERPRVEPRLRDKEDIRHNIPSLFQRRSYVEMLQLEIS
jgi:hypothetical protein